MTSKNCPSCNGTEVHEGVMEGGGEFGRLPASIFVPRNMKGFRLGQGISIPANYSLCLGCGLLWQSIPAQKLKEIKEFISLNKAK